jgi:hypothetical protein
MIFIGMSERTSGIIRGHQVSLSLKNSKFIDATQLHEIQKIKNEIVVFVRSVNDDLVKHLKRNGCIIGYDLLDRISADKFFYNKNVDYSRYNQHNIDFYIVNNSLTKNELSSYTEKNIYVIPHHHVNFGKHKNNINKIKTVGYVGLPEQLDCYDDLKSFCNSNNLNFITTHPNTPQECIDVHKKIDLGVIFLEKNDVREVTKKYKPNAKLTNFQSFGIPVISVSYESYREFGNGHWVEINDYQELEKNISLMINDESITNDLSEKSYQHAVDNFHITNISKLYQNIINEFHV